MISCHVPHVLLQLPPALALVSFSPCEEHSLCLEWSSLKFATSACTKLHYLDHSDMSTSRSLSSLEQVHLWSLRVT
ncbi:hypothetical protein KC19_VG302200 [Ceratodon purpureus]|uniref:Secreted protein n=1 Tax=Ceratodon purpureus TaxID=3225 RepID=A0A8T0HWT0_CERPU|nr:hypothetical protein KC19_VG302200 [Ceratodon purpureus]